MFLSSLEEMELLEIHRLNVNSYVVKPFTLAKLKQALWVRGQGVRCQDLNHETPNVEVKTTGE